MTAPQTPGASDDMLKAVEGVWAFAKQKGVTDFECIEIFARCMMFAALQHCENDTEKTVRLIDTLVLPNINGFKAFISAQEKPALILPAGMH